MWSDYPCVETDWRRNRDGYGIRYVRGSWPDTKYELSNRVALEDKLGRSIAPGLKALHRCDNPSCIQPEHLYEGSHGQNMKDMVVRDRSRNQFGAALTQEQRLEIQRRYVPRVVTQQMLSVEFGVSLATVERVLRGERY